MNKPGILLVYRAAKDGDRIAARCICCDVSSPQTWKENVRWDGFILDSGASISFKVAVSDVSGGPFGPIEVYGTEEFMNVVDHNDRIPVMVAQNSIYIEIDQFEGEIKCPFFVSLDEPTRPCSFQTVMDISINGLEQLPEVVDHDTQARASIADKWDAMAYSSLSKSIGYPTGCRFPATMVSEGRECSVVYTLLESPRNGVAGVRIESSDASVSHDKNSLILRRFRGANGTVHEVEIGKLIASSMASC
jgi:hypothetical protein